ncbi:MAG TPA: glycerophosphodiester phosphodiesterase family protein [Pyrinomonadaceae bacterium]|nr:glycerophosphodiester phosphodiesterase family protein [Pyrinomonadaceae bacterium]
MEPTHEQDARATSNPLPLILGHRGSSAVAPENTLAAFKRSITDGAHGFEFDVRLARDGKPVVIHDATLQRTANNPAQVSALTSDELAAIDVGSWFNLRFPEKAFDEYRRETVPTLAQVFALIAGANQHLDIEMKCERNESGRLAAAVVRLIKEYSLTAQAVVSSFDLSAIAEVKQIASDIRTAALFRPRLKRPTSLLRKIKMIDLALEVKADELALHHTLVSKRMVEKAKDVGLPVVVWTVDHVKWVKRAQAVGIRALITNDPASFLAERMRLSGVR